MKQISTRLLTVLGLCMFLFSACNNSSDFTVKGVVAGADGQLMYLENVGISNVVTLDSIKLAPGGKFKFTEKRPEYPDFYRLRLNNQLINFAVDSTETISFVADAGTFATSYSVEGSENSKAIKAITLAQLDANQAISRLRKEYEDKMISDTTYRTKVLAAADAYKEVARKYIYSAPMSTAAYFALFQQIDGLLFFDLYDRKDVKAYGAVATSYDHAYPESPRSKHLYNLTLQSMKVLRAQRPVDYSNVETKEISFLDIELPDVRGEVVKLSTVAPGKVVLINFTAYQTEWSPALNMALGELYTKYHDQGLEIYQVSLDSDFHFWRNGASNLPWVTVRDPQSVYSQVAGLYNVKQLPALFILDRKGNLVKRVEDVKKLETDVKAVL
ncbi:TlpA disulfide reductase family protein [Parabacteroides johnsonii]|nr:TlpA disulfide reductase family protein [Parabacteroides johnsonii]MDR4036148.1 TlpA disulfide reductase family protein [Parabacteroides sp.]MBS6223616.1 AhpC/TSA family protein [Parabacteroides johnsonii]MCS3051817.1 AhpC/TSA family protein [Parabacteroides johnsonii]MDC7149049.1 TlpA disulfide reductase family protein [Parabacteroides johnsonii]MDC7157122.1 TlpA disulfide reductase family protein [Parabacteroides johnsonii]